MGSLITEMIRMFWLNSGDASLSLGSFLCFLAYLCVLLGNMVFISLLGFY